MNSSPAEANQAILFTSKQCPHCPTVKKILSELNQSGTLAALDIFDISEAQSLAEKYQVRSVPWFKIGQLEFQGLHTVGEISYWAANAGSEEGILKYLTDHLKDGKLSAVESLIEKHPDWLSISMKILSDPTSPIQARIGLGAVLEGFEGNPILDNIYPDLVVLTKHDDHRVRGDACHYLGFYNSSESREVLTRCLDDEHEEVREIAQDSLEDD